MKLNADLGESYGNWQFSTDANIMPLIDYANIACGFHAGDPHVMQQTLLLAKQYGVKVGAHPSYPDLQGFGRRSMRIPPEELVPLLHAQISTLTGMAKCAGLSVEYVKPHGALYNDMMTDRLVRDTVFNAMKLFYKPLPLVMQAGLHNDIVKEHASQFGVEVWFEAFADRRYTDEGLLQNRNEKGAVLSQDDGYQQAHNILIHHHVITQSGNTLSIKADTLCVHGDTPQSLALTEKIRSQLLS